MILPLPRPARGGSATALIRPFKRVDFLQSVTNCTYRALPAPTSGLPPPCRLCARLTWGSASEVAYGAMRATGRHCRLVHLDCCYLLALCEALLQLHFIRRSAELSAW